MNITKRKDELDSGVIESAVGDHKNNLPRMSVLAARGAASFSSAQLDELSSVSRLTVHEVYSRLKNGELISLCREAEILGITRRATINIDEELISGMPGLRGIAVYASGYDWIDLEALDHRGIVLSVLPDYSTQTVAEHTWGMILTMSRRLHLSERVVTGELPPYISLRGWELSGKTVGIIGMGRIGRAVARIAGGFLMKVIYHDKKDIRSESGTAVSFDDLLSCCDIAVIACSYERGSPPIIDSSVMAGMKPGAYLVNPVRQALVDNDAILQAIRDKRIAGYAVDDRVFTGEQLSGIEPGRIFQSGHTAWYSDEAIDRGTQCWVDNLIALTMGRPVNLVSGR
jgi:lactate dehydrogenase-like 2-hydroxyacid dehydrogenase